MSELGMLLIYMLTIARVDRHGAVGTRQARSDTCSPPNGDIGDKSAVKLLSAVYGYVPHVVVVVSCAAERRSDVLLLPGGIAQYHIDPIGRAQWTEYGHGDIQAVGVVVGFARVAAAVRVAGILLSEDYDVTHNQDAVVDLDHFLALWRGVHRSVVHSHCNHDRADTRVRTTSVCTYPVAGLRPLNYVSTIRSLTYSIKVPHFDGFTNTNLSHGLDDQKVRGGARRPIAVRIPHLERFPLSFHIVQSR